MHKHYSLLVFFFFVILTSGAQNIDSAVVYSSNERSSVKAVTTDKYGNVFVAGYFTDTVYLQNKYKLNTLNKASAMFVSSYTPDGKLRYSNLYYMSSQEDIKLIADDSGNLFIGALFSGLMTRSRPEPLRS